MTETKRLRDSLDFNATLGFFYGAWTVSDALMDFALGHFLRLTTEETHIVTAGMPYGRKTALLRMLVKRSDHKNKATILRSINTLQNDGLRNVFAHSYLASDETTVTFVERSHSSDYWAKEHHFTMQEFGDHVSTFCEAMRALGKALETEPFEFEAFQHAALSVTNSPATSPTPPSK